MDGGRRLLRSVNGLEPALASPRAVFAAGPAIASFAAASARFAPTGQEVGRPRIARRDDWQRSAAFLRLPGLGLGLGLASQRDLYSARGSAASMTPSSANTAARAIWPPGRWASASTR